MKPDGGPAPLENLPEKLYRLRPEALRVGDVIASTVPSDPMSRVIRFYTGGAFSHVALCVKANMLMEAADFGVLSSYPYRLFVADRRHLAVFRPKVQVVDFHMDTVKAGALAICCIDIWLAEYGMKKALATAIPFMRLMADDKQYYCSELVARAYRACEIELCPGVPPHRTTPRMVYESGIFDRVQDDELFEVVTRAEMESVYGIKSMVVDQPAQESHLTLFTAMALGLQENRKVGGLGNSADYGSLSLSEYHWYSDTLEVVLSKLTTDDSARKAKIRALIANGHGQTALKVYEEQCQYAAEIVNETRAGLLAAWSNHSPLESVPEEFRKYLSEIERSLGLQFMSMMAQVEDLEFFREELSQSRQNT